MIACAPIEKCPPMTKTVHTRSVLTIKKSCYSELLIQQLLFTPSNRHTAWQTSYEQWTWIFWTMDMNVRHIFTWIFRSLSSQSAIVYHPHRITAFRQLYTIFTVAATAGPIKQNAHTCTQKQLIKKKIKRHHHLSPGQKQSKHQEQLGSLLLTHAEVTLKKMMPQENYSRQVTSSSKETHSIVQHTVKDSNVHPPNDPISFLIVVTNERSTCRQHQCQCYQTTVKVYCN